jgi:hypothetical protein
MRDTPTHLPCVNPMHPMSHFPPPPYDMHDSYPGQLLPEPCCVWSAQSAHKTWWMPSAVSGHHQVLHTREQARKQHHQQHLLMPSASPTQNQLHDANTPASSVQHQTLATPLLSYSMGHRPPDGVHQSCNMPPTHLPTNLPWTNPHPPITAQALTGSGCCPKQSCGDAVDDRSRTG